MGPQDKKKFEIQSNTEQEENKKFEITKRTKFEIQDISETQPEEQGKKFEIQSYSEQTQSGSKKFEVQNVSEDVQEGQGWWKQANASDCGPMAILNGLKSIGFDGGPKSVQQIRDAVAIRRIREGQSTQSTMGDISSTGWLNGIDLWQYLVHDLKVPADIVTKNPNDIEQIKRELSGNSGKFYIMNTGNHFQVLKGTNDPEVFELLDSFSDGPQTISRERAYEMIEEIGGITGVLVG